MEGAPKQKKTIRRVKKAASSPIPKGPCGGLSSAAEYHPICGHHGCEGGKCNVRYVGPVTSIRDHHVVHAARGAAHVWTAAIVAGLAVVVTGAVAYTAFGADVSGPTTLYDEFRQINTRLDKIEVLIKSLNAKLGETKVTEEAKKTDETKATAPEQGAKTEGTAPSNAGAAAPASAATKDSTQCLKECVNSFNACYAKLGNRETCLYGNGKDVTGYKACRESCTATTTQAPTNGATGAAGADTTSAAGAGTGAAAPTTSASGAGTTSPR